MNAELPAIVAEHIRAVNSFDTEAIVSTFAADAYVNDNRREIVGIHAIRRWIARELVGDKVIMTVRNVRDHYGETIVEAAYDGNFDRTNLPAELILTNYFTVRGGRIVALVIVFNQPSPYG